MVPGGFERNGNWAETPSATYDKTRFPRGLKPVADAAHVSHARSSLAPGLHSSMSASNNLADRTSG